MRLVEFLAVLSDCGLSLLCNQDVTLELWFTACIPEHGVGRLLPRVVNSFCLRHGNTVVLRLGIGLIRIIVKGLSLQLIF